MKKLVRDKIPQIIEAEGRTHKITPVVYPGAFEWYVKQKLTEELTEVLEASTIDHITEELGDLLEVMKKYASIKGIDWKHLENKRAAKGREKGYFDKGLIMEIDELEWKEYL